MRIHKRNGSTQKGRYHKNLDPSQLQLMELGVEDWVLFACKLAKEINFFNASNQQDGDWSIFFQQVLDTPMDIDQANAFELESMKSTIQKALMSAQIQGDLTPHLTLFIAFLKLLEFSRSHLNTLTKKHLDFYYREVLKFDKQAPTSDSVYVVLELAKNAANLRLESGTTFLAGKNQAGENLLYKNSGEMVINTIQVEGIRTLFHDKPGEILTQAIIKDPLMGEHVALQKQESWATFGNHLVQEEEALHQPLLGFVIASQTLLLREGTRHIKLIFNFQNQLTISEEDFLNTVQVFFSTADEWILYEMNDQEIVINNPQQLILSFELDNTFPSLVPLETKDPVWHQLSGLPAMKFEFLVANETSYKVFNDFSTIPLDAIEVNVDVQDVRNIHLENDQSILNPTKPFYPFSTRPFAGSSFSFGYPEAFSKKCTKVNLSFAWKNTPADFREHYSAYVEEAKKNISSMFFVTSLHTMYLQEQKKYKSIPFTGEKSLLIDRLEKTGLKGVENIPYEKPATKENQNSIVGSNQHFNYTLQVLQHGQTLTAGGQGDTHALFLKPTLESGFEFNLNYNEAIENRPSATIRVNLQQSFLHELYPKILAMILTSEVANKILPNEPYTPLAADLKLSYKANTQITKQTATNKLFYIHPFGLGEKNGQTLISSAYQQGGNLYLGLSEAKPNDTLSLLFQLDEGTENPLSVNGVPVQWSILGSSDWESLSPEAILMDETNNLLSSGIVRLQLPRVLHQSNTAFPLGLTWLRLHIQAASDSVCRSFNIHAQAVKLHANDPWKATHLPAQLPSQTISKLEKRTAPIKSITQPYASLGGKPLESDLNLYRRISERLRHKNRAITLWDYEHLVLEEFPEILLSKCLNHTFGDCFHAPGHVTLVVVPKHRPLDFSFLNYPKVSEGKLLEIKQFIEQFISPSIEVHVKNPHYEQVDIELSVRLKSGFDWNFYEGQLKKDLINFLSPWAFDLNASVNFNREIHRSQLVYFVENLEYIDFIGDLSWRIGIHKQGKRILPSSPLTVIVSGSEHRVTELDKICAK
ncbi:baseplate J/gp47 family protein [Mongoliitalea daihaiensis]|uniref:hypothetical protein n=1 Tax=Mongoliitalea daihaiensis TaxID=2782006 RepID=UPI001F4404FE|nr:hypothetical protein [Mongoliitalea daihaiensis]UJP63803.1 baseplate J/gp47 family protein [Mongoliitalea daihaiensis]